MSDVAREFDRKAAQAAQKKRLSRTATITTLFAGLLIVTSIVLFSLSSRHLGRYRRNDDYREVITTEILTEGGATGCTVTDLSACPNLHASVNPDDPYILAGRNGAQQRIRVTNRVINGTTRELTLVVLIEPCDRPMDETLFTSAILLLLTGFCTLMISTHHKARYKEYCTELDMDELSEPPTWLAPVTSARKLLLFMLAVTVIVSTAFLLESEFCVYYVPELYQTQLGFLALVYTSLGSYVVARAYELARTSPGDVFASFGLSVVSIIQLIAPLFQVVWHLNHTICELRPNPYFVRALGCTVLMGFSIATLVSSGIGMLIARGRSHLKLIRIFIIYTAFISVINFFLSLLFMVAASDTYTDFYLNRNTPYCTPELKEEFEQRGGDPCLTSGIMPWALFTTCWELDASSTSNTTVRTMDKSLSVFVSCRLCEETRSCYNSEPNEVFLADTSHTTRAALAYVCSLMLSMLGIVFASRLLKYRRGAAARDLHRRKESLKDILRRTAGSTPRDVVRRGQHSDPISWNVQEELAYTEKHAPGTLCWRVRITTTSAWRELSAHERREAFQEYLRQCHAMTGVDDEEEDDGDIEMKSMLRRDTGFL